MRKTVESHLEEFSPVRLFLEDLESIVGYLSEASSKIDNAAYGYHLDSLAEVSELKVDSFIQYINASERPLYQS